MGPKTELLSSAGALLIQWLALWRAAYAQGRAMNLFAKFDPARAAQEAEQLEIWSRFALFTLLGQIAALGPATSKQDEWVQSRLRVFAGGVAMLCALAAKVKRECAQRILVVALNGMFRDEAAGLYAPPPRPELGFNDSS